uniref:Uncharacterized protein n=1 Tax=Candidatus Kentrum sp. DK TaxID=2126562 RepID=A0A450T508_9GAMM|nr:MAG: hypothetical protein BECKDK2373B_GA0170837_110312 [Candidatus Kentron sp. DK]
MHMQQVNRRHVTGHEAKRIFGELDLPVEKRYHIRLEVREDDLPSAPSLMDLCNVDGEHCFSSVEEVDRYIRGLRDEWP